jgi:ATP-dependent DNA helicase RecG
MPDAPEIALTTNIASVPGVGDRRATAFRRLGIRCVADLIRHLPLRWEHELAEQSIAGASEGVGPEHGAGAHITVRGEVATVRAPRGGRRPRFEATLEDETGTVLLTWFNAPWMRNKLHPGMTIRAVGKAQRYGDYVQMVNPRWERLDEAAAPPARGEGYRPVYPASEDLTSRAIESAVNAVLEPALARLEDHLHEAYRSERALPALADAYRMMHHPESPEEWKQARRRLALDELLMLQLGVMLKRRHRRETLTAPALHAGEAIDRHITERFPFALTDDQRTVIDEITTDLAAAVPMNRLLQGDVGAGKTVVALYAMLLAVASDHQAALMAPTALLAEQHFGSITSMLAGSQVSIELLTGALKASERRSVLERLESGEIDLLVGTHALLTETVGFSSLAVIVIDEQHRFGVHQRALLRTKAGEATSIPHTLVMTATPIPRTMSLTVFGDLDVSTIRHLPPGRQPVITRHVPRSGSAELYEYVSERIGMGDQAYVVVPAIDESDSGLRDIGSHLDRLAAGPLHGRRIAALHGRLSRDERDEIMGRFRAGAIDVLVATTVIEVGVDVPNASIMVVEDADRFGLAQLHQLRGRVGRGSKQSLCVLVADPATDDGRARIDAIVGSADGFEIAERDLEIRGPGELFGSRQSGLAPFQVARIPEDMELLRLARRDATAWVEENPTLSGERDALLKRRLLKAHGEALGLGDVG